MAQEIWKPIPGFDARYEVSNLGRIRSLPFEFTRFIRGQTRRFKSKLKILKFRTTSDGYYQVDLTDAEGKKTTVQVQRVVLLAFVGPPPAGHQARHFPDQDKTNNKLENLCWGTVSENQADKIAQGTAVLGEDSPNARLTEDAVRAIRASDETNLVLAARYGVSDSLISKIRRGLKWTHVK